VLQYLLWWSQLEVIMAYQRLSLGTGKTLCARALANECSKAGRHVSFFMRKGTVGCCLSAMVSCYQERYGDMLDVVPHAYK
jgi:hypothetical protein